MKVVHLSTSNGGSGAGIAAYRIHSALRKKGVHSTLMSRHNFHGEDDSCVEISHLLGSFGKKLMPYIDKCPNRKYAEKDPALFSSSWMKNPRVLDKINQMNADIIHLHWINFGLLSIEELPLLNAPIVWTMHDNWLFTGGCHIMWDCKSYLQSCGNCPRLNSKIEEDLSRKNWKRKKESFEKIDQLYPIAPSNWLQSCSDESSLLHHKTSFRVPNPIDLDSIQLIDKKTARQEWGFDQEKKIILFGALSATKDLNKGYDQLMQALQLTDLSNAELVIFGSDQSEGDMNLLCPVHFVGQLNEWKRLNSLYSSADVMIVPSRQEAFGQIAAEAMACGTPVVAFGHTGLLDIIDHQANGYLARPGDASDLAKGIEFVLSSEQNLGGFARQKISKSFAEDIVSQQYLEIYDKVLTKSE